MEQKPDCCPEENCGPQLLVLKAWQVNLPLPAGSQTPESILVQLVGSLLQQQLVHWQPHCGVEWVGGVGMLRGGEDEGMGLL
jgi:hypothetical protein